MRPGAPQVASKSQRPLCFHGDSPRSVSSLSFLVSMHMAGLVGMWSHRACCGLSLLGDSFLVETSCSVDCTRDGEGESCHLFKVHLPCVPAPLTHLCWGIYSPNVGEPHQDCPGSLVEHCGGGTVSQSPGAASAAHLLPFRSGVTSLPGKASRLCLQWERSCTSSWGYIYLYL